MKKIKMIMAVIFALILLTVSYAIPASAIENSNKAENEEILETVHGIYDSYNQNVEVEVLVDSSSLIVEKKLTLSKKGNSLIITAITKGTGEVTKCGFTYIKLQRLINGKWQDYTAYCYTDQYSNSTLKNFTKTVTPPKGYTYRLICEHYAEKKKLLVFKDKQTVYNATASLSY